MAELFLFKSFPTAMLTRHFQRAGDLYRYKKRNGARHPRASWIGYYSALILGTTMIAAVSNMFKDLLNGQDIQDPFTTDNIARAFTSGGGAGLPEIFCLSFGRLQVRPPEYLQRLRPGLLLHAGRLHNL